MCGPFIVGLVFPTLRVYRSRSGVVPEHKPLEVVKEICALIEAGVCGVETRVTLWGDEGWGGGHPGGVVDPDHVRSQCVPRGRWGYEGDVRSFPGDRVSVGVTFLRYGM